MILTTTQEDAQSNYVKNRGEPGKWFQHKADFREEKPVPRIRQGGYEIYEKSKSTIGDVILPNKYKIKNTSDDSSKTVVRLTSEEALRIADKFKNQPDKWFDFGGNLHYKPPRPPLRLYTETAKELADVNHQQRSHDWYVHSQPKSSVNEPIRVSKKCFGSTATDICQKMKSSHAEEWFAHPESDAKGVYRPSSAPISAPRFRVSYEGTDYAERAKGIGGELLIHDSRCDAQYNEAALPYRCVSSEAGGNCRHQTGGRDMAQCLGRGSVRESMAAASMETAGVDRVKSDEARDNLLRGRMGFLATASPMSVQGSSMPVRPKVRPEAEEFYVRSRGAVGSIIDQSQNKGYQSPKPKPRITTLEAQQAADTNKGVMSSIVGDTGYPYPKFPKKHQIRATKSGAANENADRAKGSSMKSLVENYRLAPEPAKPRPVIMGDSEEAAMRRCASVGNLFSEYGKRSAPVVPPLRISGFAVEIADKHKGSDLFKTIQQVPPSR